MTDIPVDPALIAQHAEHQHKWAPPSKATTGGIYVHCENCTAWWSDPIPYKGPTQEFTVPDWMTKKCSEENDWAALYPPNVPSNTIDANPPKGS